MTIGFHRHFTHGAFKANRGRILEKLGWATHVRWPKPERLARRLKTAGAEEREPA